jgi:hypothetical protein
MNLNPDAFGRSTPNRIQNMGSETTHGSQSIVNVILQEPWHDAVTTIRSIAAAIRRKLWPPRQVMR